MTALTSIFRSASALLILFFSVSIFAAVEVEPESTLESESESHSTWQIRLQPPSKSLWLGQPSDWLLVYLNSDEEQSKITPTVTLPESPLFLFETSQPSTVVENGINGLALTLRITPLKAGQLELPQITVSHNNEAKTTQKQAVSVNQATLSENMQLSLNHSKSEIFLGESLRVKMSWTFTYPVKALQAVQLNIAEFQHADVKVLAPWNKVDIDSKHSIGLPISGRRIIGQWQSLADNQVQIDAEMVIQPTKAGDYYFPAATLQVNIDKNQLKQANQKRKVFKGSQYPSYFDNAFFEDEGQENQFLREQVSAPAFTLKVKPLPKNAPENFTGIIGKPEITATASPLTVEQGEPIQYSLVIEHGDIEAIPLADLADNSSFTRSFDIPAEASPGIINEGIKTIHQSIFPRRADIEAIPALALSYFDPDTGLYRDYQVDSIAISVTANDQFDFSQGQSSDNIEIKNKLSKDEHGIWAHRWGKALTAQTPKATFGLSGKKWLVASLLLLLPPIVVVLFLLKPLSIRRNAQRMQYPYFRFEHALATGQESLMALSDYCHQRLDISPSQFSAAAVKAGVLAKQQGKNTEQIHTLAEQISSWITLYQQQYAQLEPTNQQAKDNYKQLIVFVKQLEKLLPKQSANTLKKTRSNGVNAATYLAIFLTGAIAFNSDNALAGTDTLAKLHQQHQQALQLSIDSPHQANIAHGNIAMKLTQWLGDNNVNQANLAYNIGSSWYHAGRYGQSILWLRRAENLAQDDELILHNLSQARQQRLDDLPVYFAPLWLSQLEQSTQSALWKSFCYLSYLVFCYFIFIGIKQAKLMNRNVALASCFVAIAALSQVFVALYDPKESEGVITAIDIVSRKGPGLIFSPAFTTPLNQGTEFLVLQQQDNWSEVQLSDLSTVWLPNRAFSLISDKL